MTRVIAAVEAFGGTVKDLAGDGVLALFGAPVAHEDDPERAVRAGLRIVEDITRYGREVEQAWGIEGFSVRVGVNTGLVVVGDGGFSHAPFDEVIERARQERSDRGRLELFHEADRMVVAERVACIPLVYARSMAVVTPRVHGGWEFGKTSANFADLWVETEGGGKAPVTTGVTGALPPRRLEAGRAAYRLWASAQSQRRLSGGRTGRAP